MQDTINVLQSTISYMKEDLGLEHIRSYKLGTKILREYRCLQCGGIEEATNSTISRWKRVGEKFCKRCRGAVKAVSSKEDQLNARLFDNSPYFGLVRVVEYLGYDREKQQGYAMLQFLDCGHTKKYSTTILGSMARAGKMFACGECCKNGDMVSALEKVIVDKLSGLGFDVQVKYSDIADCDRRWTADLYNKDLNMIIEVTTVGGGSSNYYSKNFSEKLSWAERAGVTLIVIKSLHELEDIVQKCSVKQSQP